MYFEYIDGNLIISSLISGSAEVAAKASTAPMKKSGKESAPHPVAEPTRSACVFYYYIGFVSYQFSNTGHLF